MGRPMLSKSLIQFSVGGRGCVPSLLFELRPNYGGGDEDNGDFLQKFPCRHCHTLCPRPCSRPPLTHAFARESRTPTGKPPVGSLFLSPGSWCTRFCCALQESISQSYVSSGSSIVGLMETSNKRTYTIPTSRAPGKGQFSFEYQRKAIPKNAQSTTQLHLSHTLAKNNM